MSVRIYPARSRNEGDCQACPADLDLETGIGRDRLIYVVEVGVDGHSVHTQQRLCSKHLGELDKAIHHAVRR